MHGISSRRLGELLGDTAGDRLPRYAALAARIRLLTADGRLPVGVRLPAERDLAAAPGLSRATVTAAYARLLPQHGYHPGGLPELRARIAERYSGRGLPTTPEQVLVTAGALHGLTMAFESVTGRGDRLLVEHPTYPNALDAAWALGRRVLPFAVDLERPDEWLDGVERALGQARPAAAYVMPDFQNPTGLLLDQRQRERLARALTRAGTRAVVDETFVELGLDTTAGAPLAAFAPGHLSVGSLSKAFWGGMRIGWVRAEADLVRRLTAIAARSQMSGPAVEQLAACHLLDGADAALEAQRRRLRERRRVLVAGLRQQLPAWGVPEPAGGLVLWCRLPSTRSTVLAAVAERHGLRLAAGPRYRSRLRRPAPPPLYPATRAAAACRRPARRPRSPAPASRGPLDPAV